MMSRVRTTITVDDELFRRLKERAHRAGTTFKQVVNETLRRGLSVEDAPPKGRRFRLEPSSMGKEVPGIELDKALALAERLEDQAITRKLEARK